ncbi:hypothetical protein H4R26_003929 [Coemansia thaxteri]|uniref:Uncharacterized protein n=1 Tax=Coemansia thaxteri TaxID=2663907 RepID=A0A9W8BC35_9FUNG|nr:hypothetical protein H4R26_003929 [Coemansia thaxteri]KAJ2477091.1 hypothetical protein EV174_004727 [Coemansia sp. RSA 2320]
MLFLQLRSTTPLLATYRFLTVKSAAYGCSSKRQIQVSASACKSTSTEDTNASETDSRHQEFCKSFLSALKEASASPPTPLPIDKATEAIDQQLAGAFKELFAKYEVPVTPKLLEKREWMRKTYPELFKDISDKELDG